MGETEEFCRLKPSMAGNNLPVFVDQKGRIETERRDTFRDEADLRAVMFARIVRGGD
jgi:hypothetical protein